MKTFAVECVYTYSDLINHAGYALFMLVSCSVVLMLHGRLYRNVSEDMQFDLPDYNGDPNMVIPKPTVKVHMMLRR